VRKGVRRLLVLSGLGLVATGSGVAAVRVDAEPARVDAAVATAPLTPVLSARRVPSLLIAPVAERRLRAALDAIVAKAPPASCLTVTSGGKTLYNHNPDQPLVPASLEKLFTAAAVLHVLGPDATFTTQVVSAAGPADGVVTGDVWLVGSGDPIIATTAYALHFEHQPQIRTSFEALADAIVAAGVRQVSGSVLGDESRYDQDRYPDVWPQKYIDQDQTGPLSALSIDDNFVEYPPTPDTRVPDETPTDDPAVYAAAMLTAALEARGVDVAGEPGRGAAPGPDDRTEIGSVTSPPMRDVLTEMLRESDNMTAELLTKELGLRVGAGGTTEDGLASITATLGTLGIPTTSVVLADGSGLAVENQQTCASTQAILDTTGPTSVIATGLPIAGINGTLEKRFVDTPVAGRMRAKTGTLNQATALAGFVDTLPGVSLSFTFIENRNPNERITEDDVALQDELGQALVVFPQGPPLESVGPKPASG